LHSDARRLEQIVLNLLSNAIKFTEVGTVTLEAEPVRGVPSPTVPGAGDAVRIRVRDTGIGIREEHLGELFQPFHQIDAGLTRRHEGTGLGLAICRRLTALLEGEITVRSEWGRGSEFTVILPRRLAPGQ
jgi:hypothetical protein